MSYITHGWTLRYIRLVKGPLAFRVCSQPYMPSVKKGQGSTRLSYSNQVRLEIIQPYAFLYRRRRPQKFIFAFRRQHASRRVTTTLDVPFC